MKRRDLHAGIASIVLAAATISFFPQAASAQGAPPAAGAQAAAPAAGGGRGAARPAPFLSYVFKPNDIGYTAPNKPVWHIADIIAAHKGQTDWAQQVVKDPWFNIQYISMGAGKKTPVSMQSDVLIWFIINSGQVRFNIKGQDPIVAGVDTAVYIPARVPYSIETLGNVPSIRFEVRNAIEQTVFPAADNPTPPVAPPGFHTVEVNCGCVTAPGAKARSFDYGAWAKANPTATSRPPDPDTGDTFFIRDPNGFMTFGRSVAGTPMPAAGVIGHFHLGLAEWWYVIEGNMATRIEGAGDIYGNHGDLIYSPRGAFHQTVMLGAPSTRTPAGKTGANDSGSSFTMPTATPAGQ